jgi:uncharacterized protein
MERFIKWVIRYRRWVLAATLVVTVGLMANLRTLHVIIDPDESLPRSHPYVQVQTKVEQWFGNKFTIVIGITPKTGDVFQTNVLEKVKGITAQLSAAPGVIRANLISLAARKAKDIEGNADGLSVKPLMDKVPTTPQELAKLKAAYLSNPAYENAIVSKDGRTAAILVEFQKDPGGFQATDAKVRKIVEPFRDDSVEIQISGQPTFLALLEKFSERMGFLFPLAVVMIGLIHYEAFRTIQGLLLPLVTSLLAVIWSLGLMAVFKVPLDGFNASTPILILAVAAGHAVQILKRYYEEYGVLTATGKLTPRQANEQAVVQSMTKIGPVMIAAGIIATASFMSLLVFEIQTIRTFGVFTGLGITCALIVELTFIPALRAMLPPPSVKHMEREKSEAFWDKIVAWFASLMHGSRRGWMFAGAGVFTAIMLVLAFQVEISNSTREYFYTGIAARKDDAALNQRMAGTNTLYVLVEGKADDAIKNPAVLRAMEQTQRFIEQDPLVGKTTSIVDFIKRINKAMNAENVAFDKIPDNQNLVSQYLLMYETSGEPGDFDSYVDYGYRNAAIQVLLKEDNAKYVNAFHDRLMPFIQSHFPDTVTVSFGGGAAGGTAMNDVMVRGKVQNIGQIAGVVFLITAIMFRSALAGLLVLVPLVMTVISTFGVMGLLKIPLNIGTATISALAVGIGADYAIYFTYRLREELRLSKDEKAAVEKTFRSAGKATLFVSTAVAGGYLLLVTSFGFNLHLWFGILISLAMVVSSVSALTLYPGLLLTLRPRFVFGKKDDAPVLNGRKVASLGALIVGTGLLAATAQYAFAADPTPEQIMEKNFMVSKVADSISDGTFRLINAGGQERVRETVGRSKLLPNGVDNMRMTRFMSPPDVKGTVSLLIEHSEKDDDIWIYLPALKKVRRLVSSNKKDSFVGTDFSYGDVIGFKVADWKHKIVKEETVDGQPCWVIESTPVSPTVQSDSGYSKRVGWVRKDNFVAIKGESYDESGQLLKQVTLSDVQLVDSAKQRWQAMKLEAKNVQTGHRTVIDFKNFKSNQGVSSEFFTTRYMERDQ